MSLTVLVFGHLLETETFTLLHTEITVIKLYIKKTCSIILTKCPCLCLSVVRPPWNITAEQTGRITARVMWQPVEDVLIYRVVIQNLDEPTSKPSVHNVTDTKMDASGILPCTTYLISVSSLSEFLLPSEPTNYTYTTNSESAEPKNIISNLAILSEALLSDTQNMILGGVGGGLRCPDKHLLLRLSCKHKCEKKHQCFSMVFLVLLQYINYVKYDLYLFPVY